MMTSGKRTAAVALMGLVVAAGVSVPTAAARSDCQAQSTHSVCQTNGSVSIKATPEARGSGNPDPSQRVGSQGRRSCYTQATDRNHICQ
jgi:hypothetical protein